MDETAIARPVNRRQVLAGTGAAALAGSAGVIGTAGPALAGSRRGKEGRTRPAALPAPSPIPGGTEVGLPSPLDFIHFFLPGPTDAKTPILGLPGEGLDVEPSTITNFRGRSAFAVLSGQARGSDGAPYDVEFDVRVLEGRYVAEDGSRHHAAFGFF